MNPYKQLISAEKAREILGNQYSKISDKRLEEAIILLSMIINKVVGSHLYS